MLAGKVLHWERYEWRYHLNGTETPPVSATPLYQIAGGLRSQQAVFVFVPTVIDGMRLSCRSYFDSGVPKHSYSLYIAGLVDSTVVVPGWQGEMETHIEIDDLKVYAFPDPKWRLTFSELRWYIEGSLQGSLGPVSLENTHFVPAGVPLIGIPPWISAIASIGYDLVSGGAYLTGNVQDAAQATGTGGWRVRYPGAPDYTAFPVNLRLHEPPDVCPTAETSLAAGNTYEGSVSVMQALEVTQTDEGTCEYWICPDGQTALSPAIYDVTRHVGTYDVQHGTICLMEDLPKRLLRLNDDYAALIVRGGFPQAKATGSAYCLEKVNEEIVQDGGANSSEDWHPRKETLLSTVLNAPHLIEDVFGPPTYAPYAWDSRHVESDFYELTLNTLGACPPEDPGEGGPET